MMMFSRIARVAVRPQRVQRRTFIDWMTNYPDRVSEKNKLECTHGAQLKGSPPLQKPGTIQQRVPLVFCMGVRMLNVCLSVLPGTPLCSTKDASCFSDGSCLCVLGLD